LGFKDGAFRVIIAIAMNVRTGTGRKTIGLTVACLYCLVAGCGRLGSDYGLPVSLGASSDEVRKTLGAPNGRMVWQDDKEKVTEWYYSSGIVGVYNRDHLSRITLNATADWEGFIAYGGNIVKDVKLTDTKAQIVQKLGQPSKIENDDLEPGSDVNVPVVWPKESRYYWRLKDFVVEATFFNAGAKRIE